MELIADTSSIPGAVLPIRNKLIYAAGDTFAIRPITAADQFIYNYKPELDCQDISALMAAMWAEPDKIRHMMAAFLMGGEPAAYLIKTDFGGDLMRLLLPFETRYHHLAEYPNGAYEDTAGKPNKKPVRLNQKVLVFGNYEPAGFDHWIDTQKRVNYDRTSNVLDGLHPSDLFWWIAAGLVPLDDLVSAFKIQLVEREFRRL
jgi:hypothetical protein